MQTLAGTTRGLFRIDADSSEKTLDARGVRELVNINGALYAGTSQGLFRSTDSGRNWNLAGLEGRTVWQVRSSADGRVIHASVEPTALFRSDDGGMHWRELESLHLIPGAERWCVPVEPRLPARARALIIDPHNPDRIRVGVEVGGIACSDDGGETWSLVLPGNNPDIHMLFADPARSDVIYASTGYGRLDGIAPMVEGNAGVFRSEDGGGTWAYAWRGITPRYARPMCIDPRAPYALTVACAPTAFSSVKDAGGAGAMLLQSIDGGEHWRSLGDTAHSPSPANFHGLAVHPAGAGDVLTGTDSGEVWHVSSDCRWSRLAEGLPTVLAVHAVT